MGKKNAGAALPVIETLIHSVRPEPFDSAQDRLVEGSQDIPGKGFDRCSPNGFDLIGASLDFPPAMAWYWWPGTFGLLRPALLPDSRLFKPEPPESEARS